METYELSPKEVQLIIDKYLLDYEDLRNRERIISSLNQENTQKYADIVEKINYVHSRLVYFHVFDED